MAYVSQFTTIEAAHNYLRSERFTAIENGIWLSADGLTDARIRKNATGYRVEYFS